MSLHERNWLSILVCVRARVRACVRARVCGACVCVCVCAHVCVCGGGGVGGMCVLSCLCLPILCLFSSLLFLISYFLLMHAAVVRNTLLSAATVAGYPVVLIT